ncbi:DUF559 domain-containing protein [Croceibacterium ferulae]|uniref:DUF559 domain-containing protein n=1 Tax=Croceibacterium ferulae TaxID=1854641 RepID=UPI000EB16CE8|nr:DUF559 domain-containing protein [Croceibacterium ferulae]
MTERKTLGVREGTDPPAIKKKGRGWEINTARLDQLHERARDMRRHPTEAHKALADRFATADFGQYTWKQFPVIGSAIVDFACLELGMAIAIDEEGDPLTHRRDKSLEAVGIRTMHLNAAEILTDMDALLPRIAAGMRMRIGDKQTARKAHYRANPGQTSGRVPGRDGPPRGGPGRDGPGRAGPGRTGHDRKR